MKFTRFITVLLGFVLLFGLVACKDDKDSNNDPNDDVNTTETTIAELYEDLVLYEERLIELVDGETIESVLPRFYSSDYDIAFLSDTEYDMYTRTELIERLQTYTPQQIEGQYIENLISTQLFVSTVKELIADDLDQEVGAEFYPNPENTDLVYRFLVSDEGHIIIDAKDRFMKQYIKIGIDNDLLDYTELHYSFDERDVATLGEDRLLYNYFKFVEGEEAVFINNLDYSSSLSYTSIEENLYFTIEQTNSLEADIDSEGYQISYYDAEELVQVYMTIIDDEVFESTYDVFTEHGLLYRYESNYSYEGVPRLATNFIQATGYDYVKATSGAGTLDEEGIYLDNGEALYNGYLNFTYNDNYAFGSVKQLLEPGAPITDEIMNLSTIGLYLDNPKATSSYLYSIMIDDMNDVSDHFTIEGLDFFATDREQELYNYLDPDIRASIEGTNDPDQTDEVQGDAEAFIAIMNEFTTSFETSKELVIEDAFGLAQEGTQTDFFAKTSISLDDSYLYTYTYGSPVDSRNYLVQPYDDKLIGFSRYNHSKIYNYEILYDQATSEHFVDVLDHTTNLYTPLRGITKITQVSDTEFIVVGSFEMLGITSEKIFYGSDFKGYTGSDVEATFTFDTNHTEYTVTFDVDGIYHQHTGDEYDYFGERTYSLEEITLFDPLADETVSLNLPTEKEDIIHTTELDQPGTYYIDSDSRWMRLELERGIYTIHEYQSDFNLYVQVEDEDGTVITDQMSFKVETAGTYYIVVSSAYRDSIGLSVTKSPINIDDLLIVPDNPGKLEIELEADEVKMIEVPVSPEDRILFIHIDLDDFNLVDGVRPGFGLTFDPEDKFGAAWVPLYDTDGMVFLYLEANNEYFFNVGADTADTYYVYFEYVEEPTAETAISEITVDDILDHTGLLFNRYQTSIKVHFTVSEEAVYDFNYERFFLYGGLEYSLYNSDGTLIRDLHRFSQVTLSPGDYYIEYTNTVPEDIAAIVPHFQILPID